MLIQMPGRDQSVDGWLDETFAAVSRVAIGEKPPVVWGFTPFYTGNPFQAMLYSRFADQSMVAAPAFAAGDLMKVTEGWPKDLPLVVHLHWLNRVMASASTEAAALKAVDQHSAMLDLLMSRGARLVWTVHNVLPHDTKYEDLEVRLRQEVVDRASLIHVMSPCTIDMMSPWVKLPVEKVYRCDHPGYQGIYPDWISRTDARRRLRIPEGATALLLMGALKPYKGLSELIEAVDRVNADNPGSVVLIAAGKPDAAPETKDFLAKAAAHPAIRLLPGQVPDVDVQVLMRAADVVSLPYRRSLNSGVFALALSYARPVLLPNNAGSVPLAPQASIVYDSEDPDGLTEAVRSCRPLDAATESAAALAGASIDRSAVTERFAREMRYWADHNTLPPGVAPVSLPEVVRS